MLLIRDGWGFSENSKGNAIFHAFKPFDDFLLKETPQTLLICHGEKVGLPAGFQGSSEVGHMNMGAGRIVEQEVTRIFSALKAKLLFCATYIFRGQENHWEILCTDPSFRTAAR